MATVAWVKITAYTACRRIRQYGKWVEPSVDDFSMLYESPGKWEWEEVVCPTCLPKPPKGGGE